MYLTILSSLALGTISFAALIASRLVLPILSIALYLVILLANSIARAVSVCALLDLVRASVTIVVVLLEKRRVAALITIRLSV